MKRRHYYKRVENLTRGRAGIASFSVLWPALGFHIGYDDGWTGIGIHVGPFRAFAGIEGDWLAKH